MVILYSTDKHGKVLLKTDELDGQTENKPRYATSFIQNKLFDYKDIRKFVNSEIKCSEYSGSHPSAAKSDQFNGIFKHPGSAGNAVLNRDVVEELTIENTMLASSVLLTPGFLLGVVVFHGVCYALCRRKTRQNRTTPDRTGQAEPKQDKTTQDRPRQDKTRQDEDQDKPSQDKARHDKTREDKANDLQNKRVVGLVPNLRHSYK